MCWTRVNVSSLTADSPNEALKYNKMFSLLFRGVIRRKNQPVEEVIGSLQ